MEIAPCPPADQADASVRTFLAAHVAELRSMSPPESAHALDPDGLAAPGVTLWVARDAGEVVGCVALSHVEDDHVELKSMRVASHRTREGIARRLLDHVLAEARRRGARRVSLETGSQDFFAPARALYARSGFVDCPPFGSYRPDPHSTFMTMELDEPVS